MNLPGRAISKAVYGGALTISWWFYMIISSYFEMEVYVMLYESLLFMTVRIALPSNDTIAINVYGLFFTT